MGFGVCDVECGLLVLAERDRGAGAQGLGLTATASCASLAQHDFDSTGGKGGVSAGVTSDVDEYLGTSSGLVASSNTRGVLLRSSDPVSFAQHPPPPCNVDGEPSVVYAFIGSASPAAR